MRNLKRALSLTLASVMLLGMMVIGSSAAAGYSDVDADDNVEAIEVLQAIEVMVGDDRGFGPDRPVNRAEMAVVMGLLLNLDYNYYVSTCPFADVSGNFDWAKGWVGACAANGIVSGRGDGIYDPAATVTAVEAASMMMRALGYFRYQNDYADGFMVSTVRQGTKIGIFEGVGTDGSTPMTRNQVAQMALNALKSGMVEPDGNTINLTTPDGSVFTGKVNYVFVTSAKPYATAISSVQATAVGSQNGGTIVELGEQLYNGNLELNDDARDDFGRPAREWKFKGNEIGTYVKKELIRKEWTTEVTGKDLYDEITKSVLDDKNYDKNVYIDGQDDSDVNEQLFELTATALRNNKDGVGATGNGVLTQLFIDPKSGNERDQKDVTVAIINTYLAKAKADYSEKKDEVDFNVYGIKETTVKNEFMKLVDARKNTDDDKETLTVTGDDFAIEDIKKDDTFLVTVADGAIQTIEEPEVIAKATMTAFKKDSNVVVEGTKYDYSDTAEWNYKVLDRYTGSGRENLKDKKYDVYLDKYGYAIGIDLVDEVDNYIFITGVDDALSNRHAKNIEASGIFLDGTMKEITYNSTDSSNILDNVTNYGLVNTWCSYTVNKDGIYTLKKIANKIDADNGDDVAQSHDTSLAGETIDKKNIDMVGGTDDDDYKKVYGNDNTVYLNASVKTINVDTPAKGWHGIIDDVDSVTTGIDNVSLDVFTKADAMTNADTNGKITVPANKCTLVAYGAYALYDDDGYIIAAVTVADDGSTSDNWVYVTSDGVTRESYDGEADQWTWSREVALDGVETEISYKGDALKYLDTMKKYNWYEVKYKGDGNVKSVTLAVDALAHYNFHGISGIGDAKYEGNINTLEDTVQGGKDTILYEASNYQGTDALTRHNPTSSTPADKHTGYGAFENQSGQPYLKAGKTFYVNTTATTGFRIKDSTKVVFIQTNKQKETIEYYEGPDKLEDVVEDLNKGADGFYDYEISAILDGNVARVVVVRDLNKDNGSSDTKPVNKNLKVTIDTTNSGWKGDEWVVTDVKYNGTVAPTHDEILDAVKAQMASKGLEFVDATVSAGVITMEFKGANGSRFVKYTPTSTPSISTVTNSEDLEKALKSGADKVVLNGDATLSDGIPADTAVEVTEGKTLTLTGNKAVNSPVTGEGTTEITGTINAGSNIMTSEVVVGPEASVTGTIGDADSGNPSNLTFSKDVDEITSAWNVSGSITIDHDITVASGGTLNAPELVVEKGKELTFAKKSTLTTVHVTMEAGSILTAAIGDGVSYTFTKQVELWFVGVDEDGNTLDDPYVQISWAGGDTACQQSSETRKTIRNIINAMIALDESGD